MLRKYVILVFVVLCATQALAQRLEIDRLLAEHRKAYTHRETYELSQKFIRMDSTYYVGYFLEGAHRYFRAADRRGYKLSTQRLHKALDLMDKDFSRKLKRITDIRQYIDAYQLQGQYCRTVEMLQSAYQNIDEPTKALEVVNRLKNKRFVYDFGVEPHSIISWIYFRNRMHSSDKYPFLKNTIEENVEMASRHADSVMIVDKKNRWLVAQWWPQFADAPRMSHYHYKKIIYSYLLQIDSAEYVSEEMDANGYLSDNNYANLKFLQGDYAQAEEYYDNARYRDRYRDKDTKEFDYMQAVIDVFANRPDKAVTDMNRVVEMLGPTPGYGWNNLALARSYYYAGNVEKAGEHQKKAAKFKEVHIGSTWGEAQYNRTALLYQYLYERQKINDLQFRDRYYWLDVGTLSDITGHFFREESSQLLLTGELAADPERRLTLYNIFASELTIFFDETWELIRDFNPDYFISLFKDKMSTDCRPRINKYYHYFIAKFLLEDGEMEKAIASFEKVLADSTLDLEYESLLIARAHEGLCLAFEELEIQEKADEHRFMFYKHYSQLVPFAETEMKFKLEMIGSDRTEEEEAVLDELKGCSIDWVENDSEYIPTVELIFEGKGEDLIVEYSVSDNEGPIFIGILEVGKLENPGIELAYKLFGITTQEIRGENEVEEELLLD